MLRANASSAPAAPRRVVAAPFCVARTHCTDRPMPPLFSGNSDSGARSSATFFGRGGNASAIASPTGAA